MFSWITDYSDLVTDNWQGYADGLWITVQLMVISTVAGFLLAIPLSLARVSSNPLFAWPAFAYSAAFRGTPLLVQIFLFYYGLPQFDAVRNSIFWPFLRDAVPCALVVLSFNLAAYFAEVLRGGIMAVPEGEKEAARSLGMTPALTYRRIIMPRAIGIMLPSLSNEVVQQLKGTALVSTITVLDMTGVARRLAAKSYTSEPLILAGILYIILTYLVSRLFKVFERHLNAYQIR